MLYEVITPKMALFNAVDMRPGYYPSFNVLFKQAIKVIALNEKMGDSFKYEPAIISVGDIQDLSGL